MIILSCPHCHAVSECTDLESAINLSLMGTPATPLMREFIMALVERGPLSLSQINTAEWEHLGSRDGEVSPNYIRQLQGRLNTATVSCPDIAVLSSQRADVGGSASDPVSFLFIMPGSEWRNLAGAEPHTGLSDLIMT